MNTNSNAVYIPKWVSCIGVGFMPWFGDDEAEVRIGELTLVYLGGFR